MCFLNYCCLSLFCSLLGLGFIGHSRQNHRTQAPAGEFFGFQKVSEDVAKSGCSCCSCCCFLDGGVLGAFKETWVLDSGASKS